MSKQKERVEEKTRHEGEKRATEELMVLQQQQQQERGASRHRLARRRDSQWVRAHYILGERRELVPNAILRLTVSRLCRVAVLYSRRADWTMSTTMSWHNEEQQQPLLESQRQRSVLPTTALRGSGSGHGTPTEHELDTSSPSAAYRSNAMPAPSAGLEAKSALFVQVCGVGLVVAVWALVLASMPFPLPLFGYHPMVQVGGWRCVSSMHCIARL